MCGIFALLLNNGKQDLELIYKKYFDSIQHRGPDNSTFITHQIIPKGGNISLGFHRLAINDLSPNGNQPFVTQKTMLICNGEIYNHKELRQKYNINTQSNSDCEIIIHLYELIGIEETLIQLSGYFAFALYDKIKNKLIIARDRYGVRSLYIGFNNYGDILTSSELKAFPDSFNNVKHFEQGCWWDSSDKTYHSYADIYDIDPICTETLSTSFVYQSLIYGLLTQAIRKRLLSDRPIGAFLSGGLDSSLVAAILAKEAGKIHTFSIGMHDSPDILAARKVAKHIKSIHHEVIVTPEQMLDAIPTVIKQIESYDTTTVRASVPMYLLSQYIKKNTDIVVLFSGEGSDEASGGYLYFHNAPSDEEFQNECLRLLSELCYFDCLRCDKATAAHGLEVRVPFLDTEFLNMYMGIPANLKRPIGNEGERSIEKWLLRKSFDHTGILPDEILWRRKEAFSDGVSITNMSWSKIIADKVDSLITDEEFQKNKELYSWNKPMLKESYYYRKLFESHYPGRETTIPHFWLPKWNGNINDPSARILQKYTE